ncbi:hypothetical protein ACW9KT_21060 [Hymenobacter sp. HD11105]
MNIHKLRAATPPAPDPIQPNTSPHRTDQDTSTHAGAQAYWSQNDALDALRWCLMQYEAHHGSFPPKGGRNQWLIALGYFCNEKGVSLAELERQAVGSYAAPDFNAREISQTLRGIYQREAAAHGTKRYTTPDPARYKSDFLASFRQKGKEPPPSKNWLPQLLDTRQQLRTRSTETVTFAPPLFFQDDEPVIWPRTINLIQGQTGAHKSRVAELFSTVLIAEQSPACDTVGLSRYGEDGLAYTLCYVDTERTTSEQLPYALQQIRERAGYPRDAHPSTFDYISLEPVPRAERLTALEQYLTHVRTTHAGHLLIVLDVLTDCIGSFNDEKESLLLVDMLNRLINRQNVTFLCVIHENPGGMKARGHLGTEAANKASTVLQVGYLKQASGELTDVVEMHYLKRRNGRPGLTFHVRYDEASKGLIRADPAAVAAAAARRRTVAAPAALAAALATELAFGPLAAGELERRLEKRLDASLRTVRERLAELLTTATVLADVSGRECLLSKTREGREHRYALTPTEAP